MSTTKKYWKGLEDLNNDPSFIKSAQNEFAEDLPLDQIISNKGLDETSTPRRDFLKFLGFSVTAASLAACETPVQRIIPYVVKPEDVTPGVANWYASAYYDGNDYCSILVKTREGRPIKIEGNKSCPVTKGGTNARVQASVLSLYDSARLKGPVKKGGASASWSEVDAEIKQRLDAANGNVRILTSSIASPSTKQIISEFIAKYPAAKHVTYDAVSYAGLISANGGIAPSYNFDKAKVIVSFGADFLVNWLNPIEFASQYAVTRKVSSEKKNMSKHYQFESNLTVTGSNADVRVPVKPSETGLAVMNLYNALGGGNLASKTTSADKQIANAAKELMANRGSALVVCGSNDPNVQAVVRSINEMLGAYGSIIDRSTPLNIRQGNDAEVVSLISDMNEGKVDALFMYNVNPAYTLPSSLGFANALNKVKLKVSFADRADETASLADYICPDHHYLESWGDVSAKKGHYALIQPVIYPLFNTRPAQESLLKWSGSTESDYQTYVKGYWEKNVFRGQGTFAEFWNKALFDGVVAQGGLAMPVGEATPVKPIDTKNVKPAATTINTTAAAATTVATTAAPTTDLNSAAAAISKSAASGNLELCLYEKAGLGNGIQANNPWLQELPDPISKVTWDNYLTMSPADMRARDLNLMERADREADLVEISVGNVKMTLPVYPSPGQTKGTVGLALGYGRTKAGKVANEVGVNAYEFVNLSNGTMNYSVPSVNVSESKGKYLLAATQTHHTMMGRQLIKETTLSAYSQNTRAGNPPILVPVKDEHGHHVGKKPSEVDLWATEEHPGFVKLNHFWGMGIDLNSCIGCGACVVSCQAENNVPVVGKAEVAMAREMHWIRIDRYYTSEADPKTKGHSLEGKNYTAMEDPSDYPAVAFQPVMCVHCNHAPCETVCPVAATTHSSDGLNQMTYNRCVGTRYCANNCPYKVRRFNWFKYSNNAQFDFNMNDDLGKMVLNPDVVVRSRGVMEKCTMCVQRIQEGRLIAKKDSRRLRDGEIQTACAQACPTNAIVFGDFNDANSQLSIMNKDDRKYLLLEELNTQPSVIYMTKVRNTTHEV